MISPLSVKHFLFICFLFIIYFLLQYNKTLLRNHLAFRVLSVKCLGRDSPQLCNSEGRPLSLFTEGISAGSVISVSEGFAVEGCDLSPECP